MTTKTSLDIAKHPWWQKRLQARNYSYYIDILLVSVSFFPNFSNCILKGVSPLAQFLTQLFSCYVLCPHSSFLDKQVLAQTSTFWQSFPTLIMYPTFFIFLFAVLHSQHNMYLSVTLHYKVNSSKASFFLFPTIHKHLEHCSEHRPNKQVLIHYPNIGRSHHFLQVLIYVVLFDCFTPSFLYSNQPVSLLIQSVTM